MANRKNNKNRKHVEGKKLIEDLLIVRNKLKLAAKFQPCPPCKEDLEMLSESVYKKIEALRKNSDLNKNEFKKLSDLDYINTMRGIAIVVSKIIKPFTKRLKPPKLYEKTLKEDRKGNAKVKELLLEAKKIVEELINMDKDDKYLSILYKMIESDIKAVDFKLNADPLAFYLFDRALRIGYKTHLLDATGKIIVTFKNLKNRM
jgi:hypothetical protein